MNGRIIIIGNGFDLAHGLKTSYGDLMNFIKEETNPQGKKAGDCGAIHHKFKNEQNNYISFKYDKNNGEYVFTTCPKNISYYFKNLFKNYNQTKTWSDLEALYFRLLSENINNTEVIECINKEFSYLKELLEDYLVNQIEKKIGYYDFVKGNIFESENPNQEKMIGIINFNYTKKNVINYINGLKSNQGQISPKFSLINIHGELENPLNPIIFGYGDDNSDQYKTIKDNGNNELLNNFKTFQYLRNSNYKEVLAMLELEDTIKVEIIGHSCGLSDKTLLKTIFEHPNVTSIEYRYHSDESKYFNNLYNMSRIFSDTSLMRKKVIDLKNTNIIPLIDLNDLCIQNDIYGVARNNLLAQIENSKGFK